MMRFVHLTTGSHITEAVTENNEVVSPDHNNVENGEPKNEENGEPCRLCAWHPKVSYSRKCGLQIFSWISAVLRIFS